MEIRHQTRLAIITLAAFSASSVWAEDKVLEVQQQGGISYVTGGIGEDESEVLKATQANYNLRVMNADKVGHFSGDNRIIISDLQQHSLLDAISGPLFYANLPKGRYIVEGFTGGQSRKQVIRIVAGKTSYVRFMWPEDVRDANSYQ